MAFYSSLIYQITLELVDNEKMLARKKGSKPYSIAELSDGERNVILIASEVLAVPSSTMILIDEPEQHLHQSIISSFLKALFTMRSDCVFVVSTHEVILPIDNPGLEDPSCSGLYIHREDCHKFRGKHSKT